MRQWTKLLPYFIVAWLARRNCQRCRIGNRTYALVYGPGDKPNPEAIVYIEVNYRDRPDWYPPSVTDSQPASLYGDPMYRLTKAELDGKAKREQVVSQLLIAAIVSSSLLPTFAYLLGWL